VPFAYALSTLALRRGDVAWVVRSQRWAVAGWAFLSLGIGLGAWWAYVILSWGGYWGWDPVENTSFIPWLTATALLHSFTLCRRRGIFKHWAAALAAVTFWLTILATWTTRTGVISSVHAFERNAVLVVVLTSFLVLVLALGAGLLVRNWRVLGGERELESTLSRDFLYYAADVGLSLFAGAVLFATVLVPLLMGQTVRAGSYEALARPLGVLTLLAVGVCPLLEWRRSSVRAVLRRLAVPVTAAGVTLVALAATGWGTSVRGLLGLAVCAFTGVAALEGPVLAARRAGAGSLAGGMRRVLTGRRSRPAGVIVHLGVALAVAGLIGSNVYKLEQRVTLQAEQGAAATVHGYTLTFKGFRGGTGAQSAERLYAVLDVSQGGRAVGTITPHLDYYEASGQTAARAVILGSPSRDLFVSPESIGQDGVTLQVDVFPLIRLVWAGAGLLVVGGAVSLWPRLRPETARAAEAASHEGAA
jgi:cytochrome c-type biogenesis protein CcmF